MKVSQACDCCGLKVDYLRPHRIWFCDNCKGKNKILFEGVILEVAPDADIVPGDIYLAKRNTGWKMLTCAYHDTESGFVIPVEANAYFYDTHECYLVVGEAKLMVEDHDA